jgi:hypothetical protein
MFGITGLMTSSDTRNGSPGPIEAVSNLVIFSVSTISDSNWVSISQNDKLIKGRNENFADVGTAYAATSGLPTITFTIGMNGDHAGTIGSAYGSSYASPLTGGKSNFTYTAGSHNHTASVSLNGFVPSNIKTKLYKRNPSSISFYSLPVGSLVFGENLNISGLSGTSSYDNKYISSTTSTAGIAGGSTTGTLSFTTSYSGAHFHDGPTNNFDQTIFNGTGYGQRTRSIEAYDGQSHAHTGSVTLSQRKQYVKLRTYQVTGSNVFISSGMIFGFISSINDSDWFCCNGQTVRGYTTPNLVDRYVMCGNNSITSHNVTPSGINDVNDINITSYTLDNNTWNHRHGIGDVDYQNTTTYLPCTRYHAYTDYSHTHAITTADGITSYSYEPSHFNLIFYIYLP